MMRKKKRKNVQGRALTIFIQPDLEKIIRELADERGISVSAVVCDALADYFATSNALAGQPVTTGPQQQRA